MKLKLIGSKTCPFVQRSLITLILKNVPYEVEFIDLENKPKWFSDLSPTGKVPLLLVDDKDVIFESSVINEFLDETFKPILSNISHLERAKNKGWIEFSSSLISNQYALVTTQEENRISTLLSELDKGFSWLENQKITLPYFNGEIFSLVDIAFAPLFIRLEIINKYFPLDFYKKSIIQKWAKNIIQNPSVVNSMPDDYENLIKKNIINKKGILSQYFIKD